MQARQDQNGRPDQGCKRRPGQRHFTIARHFLRQDAKDFARRLAFGLRDRGADAPMIVFAQQYQLPEAPPPPKLPPPPPLQPPPPKPPPPQPRPPPLRGQPRND